MNTTPQFEIEPEEHTLLVVDDNAINLNVIVRYLNDIGFRTLIARDGTRAFERAKKGQPDLILLDVMMPPGIDGFETCKLLKRAEETKHIPIIFMTALNEAEHKVKGFEVGAADYITKPFQHEEVYARVMTQLRNYRLTFHLEEMVMQRTAELERAKKQVEAADQTKSIFLKQISHELRTPLATMLLYVSLALKKPDDNERLLKCLKTIGESGAHLQSLIERILEFGESSIVLNPEEIELRPFLYRLEERYIALAQEQGIKFKLKIPDNAPSHITVDDVRLYQVLDSLLSNGLKFTDEGDVALGLSFAGQRLRFEVSDTGTGIADNALERVFLPFEQSGTVAQPAEGIGLGLTMSQQIIVAMGSQIQVESTVGEGSRFWFELHIGSSSTWP